MNPNNFNYTKRSTGRVNLYTKDKNENGTPFFLQDTIMKNEKTNYSNATKYILSESLLSTLFFSSNNIQILQNAIRAKIYEKSNQKYIIDTQDYEQLKIVMRSIFLQYAMHRDDKIKEQIEELNKIVLDYCIPQIFNELKGYINYKKDISTLVQPLSNPEYFKSDKTLELKNFF